mgnify:CR=1 FL=1
MAEVIIRLRHNPNTGERELVVDYASDDDALPFEHEREHREMVEAVIGRPLADLPQAASLARVEEASVASEETRAEQQAAREALAEKGS